MLLTSIYGPRAAETSIKKIGGQITSRILQMRKCMASRTGVEPVSPP
jgi:hypothetical protein